MQIKKILDPHRLRRTGGSFGFIPHRFLREGFLSSLEKDELALYVFLALAADREGLSFYGDKKIRDVLNLTPTELQDARDGLVQRDLLRYEEPFYQLLDLPEIPVELVKKPPEKRTPTARVREIRSMLEN